MTDAAAAASSPPPIGGPTFVAIQLHNSSSHKMRDEAAVGDRGRWVSVSSGDSRAGKHNEKQPLVGSDR